MANAGPNICGTGANEASVGTVAWSDAVRITAIDGSFASCVMGASAASNYLLATNFNFALPTTATVLGIEARLSARANVVGYVMDAHSRLVIGGVISGDDKVLSVLLSTSAGDVNYGGAGDLWGLSPGYADINATDFGIAWSCKNNNLGGASTAEVDYVELTITYTDTEVGPQVISSVSQVMTRGGPGWRARSRSFEHFPELVPDTADSDPAVVRGLPPRIPFIAARSRVFGAADDFQEESTPEWYASVIQARARGHVARQRRSQTVLLAAPDGQASVCCCPFGAVIVSRRFATASIVAVDVTPQPVTFSTAQIVESKFATAILIENVCTC